jgi:hypothetical protein
MGRFFLIILLLTGWLRANAQKENFPLKNINTGKSQNSADGSKAGGRTSDTLGFERRDDLKDSVTITFRYLDSTRRNTIDSTINDFDNYYSVPSTWQYLGNNGAAAFPLVFKPNLTAGWDAGFHAFDIYRFTLENSRFYRTTKPFSTLSYQLASGKEQMLQAMHTQNPRPNLNFGLDYKLISAPGFFVTQNTNHNSYRIFANYTTKRKRYNAYFIMVGNTIRASENGGITNDSFLLDPNKKRRFSIPVNLGGAAAYEPNPFQATVRTGNTYRDFTLFYRHSYDLGQTDSIAINDSTTEYLFYPRLRLQHSFTYSTYKYKFGDEFPDSAVYFNWYNVVLDSPITPFALNEKWNVMNNDFSLIQFPDRKNTSQFFLAGITLQNIKAQLRTDTSDFHNVILHGEYRNRTRNKLWDMLLKGEYYVEGLNSGDYTAYASLERYLNKKLGYISLYFTNVNRSPSFVFDNRSSFNLGNTSSFSKENITSFGATSYNSFMNLGFRNHLLTNYSYFSDYYHTAQYSKLINVLQVFASKKIKLTKRWNWYADVYIQQTDGASPIKVPFLFTRNRLAFEGRFFKNLNLSAGVEARYYTPYDSYNYSPILAQFVPQDTILIKNLPDVHAFFHFRIKSFTCYFRTENLNTVSFQEGFGFVNNNFAAPHYPTQGFIMRIGIKWWFVN